MARSGPLGPDPMAIGGLIGVTLVSSSARCGMLGWSENVEMGLRSLRVLCRGSRWKKNDDDDGCAGLAVDGGSVDGV